MQKKTILKYGRLFNAFMWRIAANLKGFSIPLFKEYEYEYHYGGKMIIDEHDYLKDNRTLDEYIDNVKLYCQLEEKFTRKFIKVLNKFGFDAEIIEKTGCEKDKKESVCTDFNDVSIYPDFKIRIDDRIILLEVKCSKYMRNILHFKKYQTDKYAKHDNLMILMVMDYINKPVFTMLLPLEIIKYDQISYSKYGNKRVYCLNTNDYDWYRFE